MKKISLILNVILILAVAVLYVLHFTSENQENNVVPSKTISGFSGSPAAPASAAYVNLDTLLNNLDMYYDMRNKLMSKQQESQIKLDNNAKAFEKRIADLDSKMQKGLVTRSDALKMQEDLKKEEERILKLRENLTYQLAEEEQVMNRKMMYEIMEYLKEYNTGKNYQMIISNIYGGTLLYADDNMNITKEVIDGLNARYSKEKGNKK